MAQRTQISTVIDPDIKRVLRRMCADDLISIREQLELLITQEHNRRSAPHHKLVDTPVEYVTEKEKPMDRTAQVNELRELAENVATLGHGTAAAASVCAFTHFSEELVEYALSNAGRESWGIDVELDAHDRNLLTRFVAEALMR